MVGTPFKLIFTMDQLPSCVAFGGREVEVIEGGKGGFSLSLCLSRFLIFSCMAGVTLFFHLVSVFVSYVGFSQWIITFIYFFFSVYVFIIFS